MSSRASMPPVLSDRAQALFALVAAAAAAGTVTPSCTELTLALRAGGHRIGNNPGSISYELRRLQNAGRIAVIGARRGRVLEVVATGQRTVRRPIRPSPDRLLALAQAMERRRAGQAGWPRPTPESAASYDAAVARRDFARHELREPSGPATWIGAPYVRRSLTGCAAEMMTT
ncbi:MAG TPA: hypothetical protein VK597_04750 [Inquilinus sp.]|nr:hypothetical protein [Inquilinus sp.]